MAEFLLRNSLNPGKVIKCTITFRQIINKGEEGEPVWLVEMRTMEPHKSGGSIAPVFVHYTSASNLDEAINEAATQIAQQVDWTPLETDARAPFVIYNSPTTGDLSVSIYSSVFVDIKDLVPTTGIDPDSIEVTVNDMDVTDEIELIGDPFEYRVKWQPKVRVLDYYT